MKNIFVTGANGLLGTNLINLLLEKDHKVRAYMRNSAGYKGAQSSNLEIIRGNLPDNMLSRHLNGIDAVVHIAAQTAVNLISYKEYHDINCVASVALCEAAIEAGVKRFVYISSANTRAHGSACENGNENKSYRYPFTDLLYARSKMMAEQCILAYRNRIDVVILNPAFMIGAFDAKPGSGKIITRALGRRWIFYPPGGKNFVHVSDVARAIIASFIYAVPGERYLIANENLTYKEFYTKLGDITGQHQILICMPSGDVLRFFGIKTVLSSVNMRILGLCNFYSNLKSIEVLGIEYQPVEEAIAEAVAWFKENSSNS